MEKITKKNSIFFREEWIAKYIEEGLKLPNRRLSYKYSLGEQLEILYEIKKENKQKKLVTKK